MKGVINNRFCQTYIAWILHIFAQWAQICHFCSNVNIASYWPWSEDSKMVRYLCLGHRVSKWKGSPNLDKNGFGHHMQAIWKWECNSRNGYRISFFAFKSLLKEWSLKFGHSCSHSLSYISLWLFSQKHKNPP